MQSNDLDSIKKHLRSLGLKELQIRDFIEHYSRAIELNIPYPFYYAFSKTMN